MVEKIFEAIDILNEIDESIEKLPFLQSQVDKKISDLYHLLEQNKLDASQCWHFVKELRSVLLERRDIKARQIVGNSYRTYINRLNNKDNRKILSAELHKKIKTTSDKGEPEIYTKEQLEKLGILKGDNENWKELKE